MTITNDTAQTAPAGLFLARFEVGGEMPGAPLFTVQFAVYAPDQTLTGMGRITQAVNPPLDVPTKLQGDYTYMTVMPNLTHILVVANGEGPIGSTTPLSGPNAQLRMVLDGDWQAGVANYRYVGADGTWHEVTNAPVKQVG